MPIRRNKNQKEETFEEFYKREEWTDLWGISAENMLKVVHWIDHKFKTTQLVGTTSHQRLVIHSNTDDESEWAIIISNSGMKEYDIEFKLPTDKSPWSNAWVRGVANDLEELKQYIQKAMKESGNWPNNPELVEANDN